MTTHPYAVAPTLVASSRRVPAVVDEVTVRLVAAAIVVIGGLALTTGQRWLYAALAVDFALRAWGGPARSPLAQAVLRWVRPRVPAAPRPTAFAPKRFAAGIGAAVTSSIVLLTLGAGALPWMSGVATVLSGAMIVLPALEAALGFCVGCRIFALLVRLGWLREEVCVDCAPTR